MDPNLMPVNVLRVVPQIEVLVLNRVYFEDLQQALNFLPNLTKITIQGYRSYSNPSDRIQFLRTIFRTPSLKTVNIVRSDIPSVPGDFMETWLRTFKITSLTITDSIEGEVKLAFLCRLKQLETLNLHSNRI
jgi:hypothetical protein